MKITGAPHFLLWAGLASGAAPAQVAGQPADASACVICHRDADWVGEEGAEVVEHFGSDVHAEVGLSCHDCHGGNPDSELADQPDASMNPTYSQNPFIGIPASVDIPGFCGRCHSDAAFMRRYNPGQRIDQEQEYWTSRHGQALRRGDERVATCVDCHGVHGILRADNPESAVYPNQVAETCRRCHSDAALMANYRGPDGRPLGSDQYALWRQSVHADALLEREDLSAPTCNDCHGNHGATPPGLNSIVFVCGQCHGREASLFRESPKIEAWRLHDEYLAEAGSDSCLACHEADSPQAGMTHLRSFGECTVCHGNHGVIRPTVAMFAPLPDTPCAFCHEGPAEGPEAFEPESIREHYQEVRDSLLEAAAGEGLEDAGLFDWMVDRALELPAHRHSGEAGEGRGALRPEFQRLFQKFRIGKTAYTFEVPESGETVRVKVVRCTNCHQQDPSFTDDSAGLLTGIGFLEKMNALTAMTARAERVLLAARRGGVETRPGFALVDKAVDSQIALEALIHTFQIEGAFAEKQQEGIRFASEALAAGQEARVELSNRRLGLGVALVFILLFLVALGWKIQTLG